MPQLLLPGIHHQVDTEPQGGSTYTLSIHLLICFFHWHFFTTNRWAGTHVTKLQRNLWQWGGLSGEELPAAGRSCRPPGGLITQRDAGLIKTKDQALSLGPLKVWSGTSLTGSMSYLITGGRWSTTTAPWCFNAASLMQTNMFTFWICVVCASNRVCESDLCYIYTCIKCVHVKPGWWRSSWTRLQLLIVLPFFWGGGEVVSSLFRPWMLCVQNLLWVFLSLPPRVQIWTDYEPL